MRKFSDLVRVSLLFAVIFGVAIALQRYSMDEFEGRLHVVDGDSVRLGGEEIRLLGMDAPEYAQLCSLKDGVEYACGKKSGAFLREMVRDQTVQCVGHGRDRYERVLAVCRIGEKVLNREMVLNGWAVSFGNYEKEEAMARSRGSGIWSGEFQKPGDWRKHQRDAYKGGLLNSILNW